MQELTKATDVTQQISFKSTLGPDFKARHAPQFSMGPTNKIVMSFVSFVVSTGDFIISLMLLRREKNLLN